MMHPVSDPLMYRYGWPATHKPSVKSLHACTPRLWIPTSFIPRPLPFLSISPFGTPYVPPFLRCPTLLHCTIRPTTRPRRNGIHSCIRTMTKVMLKHTGPYNIIYNNNSRTHSPATHSYLHTHTHTSYPLILSGETTWPAVGLLRTKYRR